MSSYKEKVNLLYSKIKSINDSLLNASNISYETATIEDALHFSITSNALSLLKGIMKDNYKCVSVALSIRNIIEALTLLDLSIQGKISEEEKLAFKEQYKLIEYCTYLDMKDYQDYTLFNEIEDRFNEAKEVYLKLGYTESEILKLGKLRLPFLGEKYKNFEDLIKTNFPNISIYYDFLSNIIHPNGYSKFYFDFYDDLIKIVYEILDNMYLNQSINNTKTFVSEKNEIIDQNKKIDESTIKTIEYFYKTQCDILYNLEFVFNKTFKNGYLPNFIRQLRLVTKDVNSDFIFGYTENVKIKFKIIIEMLATFNYIITEKVDNIFASFYLVSYYDYLNYKKINNMEIKDSEIEKAYKVYIDKYPNSKVTLEVFKTKYLNKLGFLINEKGNIKNYTELVDNYLKNLFKDQKVKNSEVTIYKYYMKMYKESHNMSHGIGYLYYTNSGAWSDDISVINFFDMEIARTMENIKLILEKKLGKTKEFDQAVDDLKELSRYKRDLFNVPRNHRKL